MNLGWCREEANRTSHGRQTAPALISAISVVHLRPPSFTDGIQYVDGTSIRPRAHPRDTPPQSCPSKVTSHHILTFPVPKKKLKKSKIKYLYFGYFLDFLFSNWSTPSPFYAPNKGKQEQITIPPHASNFLPNHPCTDTPKQHTAQSYSLNGVDL